VGRGEKKGKKFNIDPGTHLLHKRKGKTINTRSKELTMERRAFNGPREEGGKKCAETGERKKKKRGSVAV